MSADGERTFVVPGRIELVGKHVDYAGGRSLTCAVDRAITATVKELDVPIIRVRDEGKRGFVEVPLDAGVERAHGGKRRGTYVVAVARRFARDFPHARTGVDITLRSTLPPSAGLSSSSALVVAIASALVAANPTDDDDAWSVIFSNPLARAEYFGAMETGAPYGPFAGDDGVGARGGAQDHVAIVCARDGHVGQFSYVPARLERYVPWPAEYVFAIGVSGVRATKTGNARARYNRVSDSARALLRSWNAATARMDVTLADALASDPGAGDRLARLAAQGAEEFDGRYLGPRFAQFREEIDIIVPATGDALHDGDLAKLGTLVDRSMALATTALANQVPETIFLARRARELGAVAASAFGAGFGGAVWAMIRASDADAFVARWRSSYITNFPRREPHADWLVTRPDGPARALGN
ncbi:MAG TPA: galactokinase family protein [Gemmatimonadaceae bacterium]